MTLRERAEKYGHSSMFFTPKTEDSYLERRETFLSAFKGPDQAAAMTLISMAQNYYAIRLAEMEEKLEAANA